ncbi:hypothetical protein [Stackebrandtia soli]
MSSEAWIALLVIASIVVNVLAVRALWRRIDRAWRLWRRSVRKAWWTSGR